MCYFATTWLFKDSMQCPESFEDVVDRFEKLEQEGSGGTPLVSIIDCQEPDVSDVYEVEDALLCDDDDTCSERKEEWEIL